MEKRTKIELTELSIANCSEFNLIDKDYYFEGIVFTNLRKVNLPFCNVSFNNCLFEGLTTLNIEEVETVRFENKTRITQNIWFLNKIKSIEFINSKLENQIIIESRFIESEIFILASTIEVLQMNCYIRKVDISFNSIVKTIKLNNLSTNKTALSIKYSSIENLILTNLRFEDSELNSLKELRKVVIEDSDLTNLHFKNLDLSKVHINFTNTNISESKYFNIIWPYSINNWHTSQHISENNDYQLYSNFNNFKAYYTKQGEEYTALKFYNLAQECFIKVKRRIPRSKLQMAEDWFLVNLLGQKIDDFGQNLRKLIFWYFLLQTALWIIFLFIETGELFELFSFHGFFVSWLSSFFPLKGFENTITGFLMKLTSAIFIWHILRTSRRYQFKK